jgi:hypothetical protein
MARTSQYRERWRGALSRSAGGTVTIGDTAKPAHNARVTITLLRRSVETDEKEADEFLNGFMTPIDQDTVA